MLLSGPWTWHMLPQTAVHQSEKGGVHTEWEDWMPTVKEDARKARGTHAGIASCCLPAAPRAALCSQGAHTPALRADLPSGGATERHEERDTQVFLGAKEK